MKFPPPASEWFAAKSGNAAPTTRSKSRPLALQHAPIRLKVQESPRPRARESYSVAAHRQVLQSTSLNDVPDPPEPDWHPLEADPELPWPSVQNRRIQCAEQLS